jgi:hypothetical protein
MESNKEKEEAGDSSWSWAATFWVLGRVDMEFGEKDFLCPTWKSGKISDKCHDR